MSFTPSVTITVPKEYGYVLLTATSTLLLGFWHGARVGSYRKAAGIPYPQPYAFSSATSAEIDAAASGPAKDAAMKNYLFNCAQRGHGQFLENFPLFLPALLIAGLRWPVVASVLGLVWSVGRVVYAVGYTRPDLKNGKGRLYGSVSYIGQLGLWILMGKMGWDMIMA